MKRQIGGYTLFLGCALILLCLNGCDKQAPSVEKKSFAEPTDSQAENTTTLPHLTFQSPRKFEPSPQVSDKDHSKTDYALEWNRFTLAQDYLHFGRTNTLWDSHVRSALESYAQLRASRARSNGSSPLIDSLTNEVIAAIAVGCDDPLVKYLHARFVLPGKGATSDSKRARAYIEASDVMERTLYSPVRKLYVSLRAAEELKLTVTNVPLKLNLLRRLSIHHFNEALHDEMMPPPEAADLARQLWLMAELNRSARNEIEHVVVPTLTNLWTGYSFSHLMIGELHIKKAWDLRGNSLASQVTEAGAKGFEENLDLSEKSLRQAWDLDHNNTAIPVAMITVCMGQGYDRNEMERWFDRAMIIDPSCYDAVQFKALYLEPKWEGSAVEMVEFGRRCVSSTEWKGRIPLMLNYTHETLCSYLPREQQASYWQDPVVWKDVSSSFEKFFDLNPASTGYRHNYAKAAYRSHKYKLFLEQEELFGESTNYSYFGGRQNFEEMLKTARSKH